jgi:uncharacterized protein (UPF0332 family)
MPDAIRSQKSLLISEHKLGLARRLHNLDIPEEVVLNSYSAMFHAARSLLFRDGISEKSHFAVFLYMKEKYSGKLEKKFINELNTLRLERHEISYGLEKVNIGKSEAGQILNVASGFVEAVGKLINESASK